jgi:hypothetical protein
MLMQVFAGAFRHNESIRTKRGVELMNKVFAAALALLLILSVFPGCQKTPDSPIVVGKDHNMMIEKAQSDNEQPLEEAAESLDLYARLGVPDTYSAQFDSKKGRLHIIADAKVSLPDSELPIIRIRPIEFTQEQAKRFANALMGSDANYVEYDYDNLTKGAYERKIELFRYGLSDWEGQGQHIFDLQYDTPQEAETAMKQLLAKAASAPDAYPAFTPSFELEKKQMWISGKKVDSNDSFLTLFSTNDNTKFSCFQIWNIREFDGRADMVYFRDSELPQDVFFDVDYAGEDSLLKTAGDAQQLAEQTIKNMGIAGFVCAYKTLTRYRTEYNEYKPAYHIAFVRQLNGVAETYTNAEYVYDGYNTNWCYEAIHFLIDDIGVLRAEYHSPCEVAETVIAGTDLLPFDQIQAIFEKMVVIVGNEVDTSPVWDDSGSMEYHITAVRLGLVSVREQNGETGLLVPAWDFLGYTRARMSSEQEWSTAGTNELMPFLTINAVDGSIIERGY